MVRSKKELKKKLFKGKRTQTGCSEKKNKKNTCLFQQFIERKGAKV